MTTIFPAEGASVDWTVMALVYKAVISCSFFFFIILPYHHWAKEPARSSERRAHCPAPHHIRTCPRVLGTHLAHPWGWGMGPPFPGTLHSWAVIPLLTSTGAICSRLETNYYQFSILRGNGENTGLGNSRTAGFPVISANAFYSIRTCPFLDPLWLLQATKLSG